LREIYLDNSATTRVVPEVMEAIRLACTVEYGNPSSLHGKGISAEKNIRSSRDIIAQLIGSRPEQVYFTSGGTEANNWAILGTAKRLQRRGKHIITSSVEHSSVLSPVSCLEADGWEVTYLPVDDGGIISMKDLENSLKEETVLVSLMHVNNETGSLQPLDQAVKIVKSCSPKIVFHVDAVQSFGKIPFRLHESGFDLASISAHKVHGPKGIGALVAVEGNEPAPLISGGDQEAGLRGGTENLPGIAGFGAAVKYMNAHHDLRKIEELKGTLIDGLVGSIPDVRLNGPDAGRASPHIVNLSFPGVRGEVLVHYLEQYNIYCSTGSACHSRRGKGSHVLQAMGVAGDNLEGAVRISFSHLNTLDEVKYTTERLADAVSDLRSLDC